MSVTIDTFRQQIISFAIQEYSFLCSKFGFKPPLVQNKLFTTHIDYLYNDIAIEIEIDWKDICIFLLVVRLDGGKLPKGYYMTNGAKSRLHLFQIIQYNNWEVDLTSIIKKTKNNLIEGEQQIQIAMREELIAWRKILKSCLDLIVKNGVNLF